MLVSWLKTIMSGKTRMSWPLQSEPRQIGKGWGREEDKCLDREVKRIVF